MESKMKARLLMTAALTAALAVAPACAKKEAKGAQAEGAEKAAAAKSAEASAQNLATDNQVKSEKFLAENAAREGVKTTPSGLQYQVLSEGPADGYSPKAEDIVDVHYVGTLIDGMEFDSSIKRGAVAHFPLNQVIPGWTEGVQLMSEGDKFRFFIPSELAYGETGRPGGPIGPNAALIFDIELVKVSSPERNLASSNKFLAENGKKAGVKTTASGLQY
jgi:FKBP-type peptidyl-prolyl cis-trans isomerase